MTNKLKNIMNQSNSSKRSKRNKNINNPIIVDDATQDNVKSLLKEINSNPSILKNMSRDEQQEYAKNHFRKSDKKRINE